MFFYLEYKFSREATLTSVFLKEGEELTFPASNTVYLQRGRQFVERFETPNGTLLLMGDPIFKRSEMLAAQLLPTPGEISEKTLYEEVKGHYYWFLFHAKGLCCGSSFGGIFPVYHRIEEDRISVSSSSFFLAEKTGVEETDTRNLLERLLFNYPFFNSTWWKGIQLLETNRYLRISGIEARVEGRFEVSDYFGPIENSSRDSLERLVALFEEETQSFFPDGPFGISMTGGFDGRTLVSAARKAGKEFFTYSFGRPGISDVSFPAAQAEKLHIPYFPIYLDDAYVEKEALKSAWSFMHLSGFNGNFGRPHYHYAAARLSGKTDFILTGNFGSELFRALHLPGVVMSESLIQLFAAKDDLWKDFLVKAAGSYTSAPLDGLIADLETWLGKMKTWEPNHRLYYFAYNDIFRKYFGAEIIMQSHYLNNRTPFLNLRFISELNRTIWSGLHSRLFEKNKGKRMKGQMFYSSFIRQADKRLYQMNTNKGYSPADVLEGRRLPLLTWKIFCKKILKNPEIDDHSVERYFIQHHPSLAGKMGGEAGAFIENASTEIRQGKDLEKWIKLYSIAAGWKAANEAISQPELAKT